MRGAIPPLPQYASWRGAQFKAQELLYLSLLLPCSSWTLYFGITDAQDTNMKLYRAAF